MKLYPIALSFSRAPSLLINFLTEYLEDSLLIFKFKQALATEAELEKIFTDPQSREAAIELLYADWLARAVK
jgi:hypothetical protein